MLGSVNIGEKNVEIVANAATPYIYKQVFGEDFLVKIQEKNPDPDLFQKMGFVMAMQAEIKSIPELMRLNINKFYEWLFQFEPMDVLTATNEISQIYFRQTKETAAPKDGAG